MIKQHKSFPFYLLSVFIIVSIAYLFWPGYMSPDSITQLNQGLTGHYSDHHPPMMSILWRLFSYIHPGPQLYLVFHLTLLLISVCFMQSLAKQNWLKVCISFIPLIPNILIYSGALWKDVGFAYSFLLAALIILKVNILRQKMKWSQITIVVLLLIYGVGVKYQAQFVLPVMGLWLGLTLNNQRINFRSICTGVLTALFVLISVSFFNQSLVPTEKKSHSWQIVKLYDLAGISLRIQENLFPDFIKQQSLFSMEEVKKRYSCQRADDLIHEKGLINEWPGNPPLIFGQDSEERDSVWDAWAKATIHHPLAYLSHRFALWSHMMSKSPLKPINQLKSLDKIPEKAKFLIESAEKTIFSFLYEMSRFYITLPFLFVYLIWGSYLYRHGIFYGLPLLMMNLTGLSLLLCLFVFSLSADLRQIYTTTCFIFFSHPLAVMAWLDYRDRRRLE